jgi:ribonuclease-3
MKRKRVKKLSIEKTLGRTFRNKRLFLVALTHPSHPAVNQNAGSSEQFQRLEFLGDAILNFFIATELYARFPKANEGVLSRLRSILVSKKLLAKMARALRLAAANPQINETNGSDSGNDKILSDIFEALIAAIYFDRGKGTAIRFLSKQFKPYFNQKKLIAFDPNPKSTLQEYAQKKSGILPVYRTLFGKKSALFTAYVTIKRRMKTKGLGRTKQEAEAQAAASLLKKLKLRKK